MAIQGGNSSGGLMTSQKEQKQNLSEPDCSGGTLVFTPRGGIVDGHMKVKMNSGNLKTEVLFKKKNCYLVDLGSFNIGIKLEINRLQKDSK